MVYVFQFCPVKTDQPQLMKFLISKPRPGYNWDFPLAVPGELAAQHQLTGAIFIIFLCHLVLSVCNLEFLSQTGRKRKKVARGRATFLKIIYFPSEFLKITYSSADEAAFFFFVKQMNKTALTPIRMG